MCELVWAASFGGVAAVSPTHGVVGHGDVVAEGKGQAGCGGVVPKATVATLDHGCALGTSVPCRFDGLGEWQDDDRAGMQGLPGPCGDGFHHPDDWLSGEGGALRCAGSGSVRAG